MDDRLEAVLKRAQSWPEDLQLRAAYVLEGMEREKDEVYELSDDERRDLEEALKETEADLASDEEVRASFAARTK